MLSQHYFALALLFASTVCSIARSQPDGAERDALPVVERTATGAAEASVIEPPFQIVRDLEYAQRGDSSQTADIYLPKGKGPFPTVLMVHGGAWAAGHKNHSAWHARRLAMHGFAAIAIDYRLAPVHKFPAQLEDCFAALAWIDQIAERFQIDRDRLGAFGYSAGGHLVCLMAMKQSSDMEEQADGAEMKPVAPTPRLRAVVAGGPPCEFRDVDPKSEKYVFWLGATRGMRPKLYEQASPVHFVTKRAPPVFLFHGERDRVVNKRDSALLHQQLTDRGVASELLVIPRAGHLRAFMDRRAFDRSVMFLKRHLEAQNDPAAPPAAIESAATPTGEHG